MRRFILIAAIVLTSAAARADGPRSLSLTANSEAATAEQAKPAEAPKAETAKVETSKDDASKAIKPANDAAPQPSKADQSRPASGKAEKPKVRRDAVEARVIYELHRHGIYW